MHKLVIVIILVIPILEVLTHPGPKLNYNDKVLFPKQNNTAVRPEPKPLSPEQIERLASWKGGQNQNMWELSGQTEGDMVLRPEQKNGSIVNSYKWKNKEIPYELSPVFSEEQASLIHEAVKEFRAKSCVTVRPRISTDVDYVYVTAEKTGCWANVGRLGGSQTINLQIDGCLTNQTIIHEFLHAAGFRHQHSATERDYYIDINWRNVQKGGEDNFGTPYDYKSIMHYSEKVFPPNGQASITPLNESWIGKLGVAVEMSEIDVEKLNEMYCDDESYSIWMYVVIAAAILLLSSLIIGVLSWCCCLSYCLSCCCCKACFC